MTRSETAAEPGEPTIMVSSSVYGIEELLESVFAILSAAGFTVWMSHKGTVPVDPGKSNFDNCLTAVEKCDLFLGILTTRYGSGKDETASDPSITHRELLRALELDKPRWFLAHHDLVFARRLLSDLGHESHTKRKRLKLSHRGAVDDLRVIDMYDAVIQAEKKLKDRIGNWAQPFVDKEDANVFAVAQFLRFGEAVDFVKQMGVKSKLPGMPGGAK
jgi:hypothetical protein